MEAPMARPQHTAVPPDSADPQPQPADHSPAALATKWENAVMQLAEMLGKESTGRSKGADTAGSADLKRIQLLFSSDVSDEDVVLVLPSLDIQFSEMKKGGSSGSLLPGVGETSRLKNANIVHNNHNAVMQQQQQQQQQQPPNQRPTMAASVLTSATKDAADAEHEVAKSLEKKTSWTKSTVAFAASALVNNISDSFKRLVDSRMKAWTLLLLRHSLSTGDESSRKRLLGILAASLKVESVFTHFTTLPLPDSAKEQYKEADVILPLLFEATITVTGDDKPKPTTEESVILRAPGTICADFIRSSIKDAKIQLDCNTLLACMVEQARMLVLKAVAKATKTQVPLATNHLAPGHLPLQQSLDGNPAMSSLTPVISTSKSLASFRSALSLTPTTSAKSPQLLKARSSALRLNSILQGKPDQPNSSGQTLGLRKNRSVRWNTPGEIPNLAQQQTETSNDHMLAKKARSTHEVPAAARLKSFKSFGRPHAGDFGNGPRNATFGEFGGGAVGISRGMWGRDGRMAAHPKPMLDGTTRDLISGEFQGAGKNAAFNLQQMSSASSRPPIHLASGGGGGSNGTSSIPRTATVLETLLMKRSLNG